MSAASFVGATAARNAPATRLLVPLSAVTYNQRPLGALPASQNMILAPRSLLTDTIKRGLVVDAQQVSVKKLRGAKYGPYQSETREHVSGIEHAREASC